MMIAHREAAERAGLHAVLRQEVVDFGDDVVHERTIRGEKSPRQAGGAGKRLPFPKPPRLWDFTPMGEKSEKIRAALKILMDRSGIGPRTLAKRAGLGDTAIRDIMEQRVDSPRVSTLTAVSEFFNVPLSFILSGGDVAVVGKIGAGGHVIYDEVADLGFVPRPPDTDGDLIGLEVEGDSMLPKFDPGDVVYISPEPGISPDRLIGAYCACRLVSGETYLKVLARGSMPGKYNLRSLNAGEMEDQELLWAAPVRAILPRFARHL